ncbi:MAG: alpha-2-macroglobulin family protein, partial [Steroidobacteraceae bacterium]
LLLFVVSRHFPERLRGLPADVMTVLARRMTSGYYHSLSAGTTLLALDAYANATEGMARNFSLAEALADRSVRPLELPAGLFPKVAFSDQATAVKFMNNASLRGYYVVEQSGFDRKPPTAAIRQGLEVVREYTDASGKRLDSIRMGEQIDVHLKVRSVDRGLIDSVALVDLLPGGFELVVPTVGAETPFIEAGDSAGEMDDVGDGAAFSGWMCQVCVGNTNARLAYADMREDRVVFYLTATNDVSEIVYRIKATNVGTYVVPPAYGEAMYDRSALARSTAGRIVVTRP